MAHECVAYVSAFLDALAVIAEVIISPCSVEMAYYPVRYMGASFGEHDLYQAETVEPSQRTTVVIAIGAGLGASPPWRGWCPAA
jgi:Na+/H+ antiporter NhaB